MVLFFYKETMQTFQDLYTRYQTVTGDDSTANTTLGKSLINEAHKLVLGTHNWSFAEQGFTATTTASQTSIALPTNCRKLRTWSLTTGGVKYTPEEIADPVQFDRINSQGSSTTSDFPRWFHIRNNTIEMYPAIASAGSTITIECQILPKDMVDDDYSTGTITSIANGATTVEGSGTTWTGKAGQYIEITGNGDGLWYQISAVTDADTLELSKDYQGASIAAATEAYTIAELPLVPEEFQDLLWFRAVSIYFMSKGKGALSSANFFDNEYRSMLVDLKKRYLNKTTRSVIPSREGFVVGNVNAYPTNLT